MGVESLSIVPPMVVSAVAPTNKFMIINILLVENLGVIVAVNPVMVAFVLMGAAVLKVSVLIVLIPCKVFDSISFNELIAAVIVMGSS